MKDSILRIVKYTSIQAGPKVLLLCYNKESNVLPIRHMKAFRSCFQTPTGKCEISKTTAAILLCAASNLLALATQRDNLALRMNARGF